MGISGLLQFIKDAGEPVNVKKYRGQSVAVDTYCWLHKGAFSCAEKLARGEPTDQYVCYCMKFVDMLLSFGVKPILVFDGRNLPSKREVEKARRERREANLQKGRQLLREGKLSEARDCFTRSVNITPAMAHNLIKAARGRGVDCVVAPYEADAQLAYLSKRGLAQAVITEDSDLLAFGCKKVILKMDKQGNGLEIDQANLGRCRSLGNVFTQEKFRHMCILSGCDYLPSLHGIGLGKACKLLRLAKDPDILKVIRKMGQYLKMNLQVPEEYVQGFVRADNTFLYQLVFDPLTRKVVPLNPYQEQVDPAALSYAGLHLGDETGYQMALGNIDLHSMEKVDDFCPDTAPSKPAKARSRSWNHTPPAPPHRSIWSRSTQPSAEVEGGPPQSPAPAPAPAQALPPPAATSTSTSTSTRGKQGVVHMEAVRLPCRELQVKRPREDCSVSELDVLQQYSSSQKRPRSSRPPDSSPAPASTPEPEPRPRNRFATLLQRRNQEAAGDATATRSRFFSTSSGESPKEASAGGGSPGGQDLPTPDSDGPDIPSVDTPSPSPPAAASPASQGLRLFRWSGDAPPAPAPSPSPSPGKPKCTTGLAALQHFHYKKESFCSSSSSSTKTEPPPDSPPSQDSAYWSQSQSQPQSSGAFWQEDSPNETPLGESSEPEQSPTQEQDVRLTLGPTAKVAGRLRASAGAPGCAAAAAAAAKGRGLGPARVSGLRKKSGGSARKAPNNENNPGVQATISSLWKNFSFNKGGPKLKVCGGPPRSQVELLSS